MLLIMTDLQPERSFWKVAAGFPADKEAVYPEHAIAQEFDRWRGKAVLEYGCGGGSDAMSYARRGCRVWAVDIVPENIKATQERAASAGLNVPAILLDRSDQIPIAEGSFDVASSHGVIHHIREPLPVLREIRRVLAPSGHLYVMLYTEHLYNALKADTERVAREQSIPLEEAFGWHTDGRGCPWADYYTEDEGEELLDDGGFQVLSTFLYNNDHFRCYRAIRR